MNVYALRFIPIVFAFIASILNPIPIAAQSEESSSILEQKIENLEERLNVLEEYLQKLEPILIEMPKTLMGDVDTQIKASTDQVVILNPVSRKFAKIETNTGTFLVSVKEMKKISEGYMITLMVGNPYSSAYSGVKMRMRWGKKWDSSLAKTPYEKWRQSLIGADYSYNGSLEPGAWTEFSVEMSPAEQDQIEYIECEMEVNTVLLRQ